MISPPQVSGPVAAGRSARSRARRRWAGVGSASLAVVSSLMAMSAAGNFAYGDSTFPAVVKLLANVGAAVMIGASVMLVWRHRFPFLVSAIAVAGTLVFPTTPLAALIALGVRVRNA